MIGYREGLKNSYKKNLSDFLKAANEIKQTYIEKLDTNISERTNIFKTDAELFSSKGEELVLFPSYTKRHSKVHPAPNSSYHSPDILVNSSSQTTSEHSGTAQISTKEYSSTKSDNAIVDVHIHGWLYSPHNGRLSRKQKLLVALARQLGGIPAPGLPDLGRNQESRTITLEYNNSKIDLERGQSSQKTEQSFQTVGDEKTKSEKFTEGKKFGSHVRSISGNIQNFRKIYSNHIQNDDSTPTIKGESFDNFSDISQAEFTVADSNLISRIGPFLSTPLVSTTITIFFYNDVKSVVRTVRTNDMGHFMIREALDFTPAYTRVLALENLSTTEKVTITEPKGVSLISDIDDTIKHTSINSGAREVFRNSFIRDLKDLRIDGVREWYNLMYDMGVEFHYVSNSPWQLFPTLSKFFNDVGMPPGSCHLKSYTSVLQGILEPVSERKKPTITNILTDFPERYFILVGDSGEVDLEVYCDVVLANPGRILMVLIRNLNQDSLHSTVDSNINNFHDKKSSLPKDFPSEAALDMKKRPSKHSNMSEFSLKSYNGQNTDISIHLSEVHDFTNIQNNRQDLIRNDCSKFKDSEALNNDYRSSNKGRRLPPPRPYKPIALRSQYSEQNLKGSQVIGKNIPVSYNTKSNPSDASLYETQYISMQSRDSISSDDTFKELKSPVACSLLRGESNLDQDKSSRDSRLGYLHASNSSLPILPLDGDNSSIKESVTNRFSWGGLASSFDAENYRSDSTPVNKKLEVWRNRWKRAEEILQSQAVELREWRVGSDVCLETIQIIEKKLTQLNAEAKDPYRM